MQFTYDNGDLVAATDPLGQTRSAFIDSAGRLLSSKTPNGQTLRYEYDALSRPVKVTDVLGGLTEFTYDANSNLLTVKDPRHNVTTYTYDNVNRLTSRTDPLLRVETFEYDVAGLLRKYTDRRGKVTSYIYDNLYRITFVGYGTTGDPANPTYESTVSYDYDTFGRPAQVNDSSSGLTTYAYDDFDQLISKTTPLGTISYTYDSVGRRTSMTVAGQSAINYTYDNANRLIQIMQGTNAVSFGYDAADRLTSRTHSNGIAVEYGYDSGSNLTSIVYKKDATVLGNLTYEYDSLGKRVKIGGSFARTGIPQSLSSSTYNQSNQLTNRPGTNFTYDKNGNLTSDGVNTYTWNARNELASISGPGLAATFQYDVSGHRINKSINGASTSYLYDRANAVQELSSATPTASIITAGVDNVIRRTDTGGARTPLTDALGSTLALVDDNGALQTEYTYDPFGNTTSSGAASANSSKYTSREDDGTGLYYYRARYYSPSLQRFISEDPIGFGGGDSNFYAYVKNDPINYGDPSGLCPQRQFREAVRSDITIADTSDSFDAVVEDIIAAILHIANNQACSDVFKKYGLRIPYDSLLGTKFRIAPSATLFRPNAAEKLGITQAQVDEGKSGFDTSIPLTNRKGAGFTAQNGNNLTMVFNANNFRDREFGGLKAIVIHEFIHAGGRRGGPVALPYGDLNNFKKEFEDIYNVCK